MVYEKLNLKDGDILKAEHLSHIEKGLTTSQTSSIGITFHSNNNICYLTDLDHYQTRAEVLDLLNRPNTTLFNYDMQGCLYRESNALRWSGILISLTGEPHFVAVDFSSLTRESSQWQGTVSTYLSIQNHKINIDSVISDEEYFYLINSPQFCILSTEELGDVRIASTKPMGNQLLLAGYGSIFIPSGFPVSYKIFGMIDEERNFNPFTFSLDPMYLAVETIAESIEAIQEFISSGHPVYAIIEPGLIQGVSGTAPVQQDVDGNLFVRVESITVDNAYVSAILRFINDTVQTYLLQLKPLSPI